MAGEILAWGPMLSAAAQTAVFRALGNRYGHHRCSPAADDRGVGDGVDNEEQGEPIAVCQEPVGGWSAVRPQLTRED